jgi:glycerate kinase
MLIHSLVCLDRAGAAGGAAISVWALLCHSVWTGSCMATRGHTRVKSMRMGMGIILAHVHLHARARACMHVMCGRARFCVLRARKRPSGGLE